MLTTCGHTFCKICIETWIEERRNCPNCLVNVGYYRELVAAPVPLKNIMSKLCIHCDYEEMGCEEVVLLESLKSHSEKCKFKPKPPPVPAQKTFRKIFENVQNAVVNIISHLIPSQTHQHREERNNRHRLIQEINPVQMMINYQLDMVGRRMPERPQRRRVAVNDQSVAMQRYIIAFFAFVFAIVACTTIVISLLLVQVLDNIVSSFILPCCVVFLTLFVITKFVESEPENVPQNRRRVPFD
ncbi:dentin sialophosphoprotein-like protein [Leptotrombidium deliense]|uniref:Dentin sialophosphoprotein-like protein n=1 Tax=Leptotrombidium deliense TaxID=299467 RepID=A0A443SVX1_9ACAR|nr:dentin sialophosphoprotein-like protein [Leptotrombidium deliense]